ncbi:transmembrane protein 170A [Aethina tumida]|uniref:transmembrane protein 170A n=1 Tax=Aethina tumida TaxID=116153 RepID=UPI00096B328D|nr:transmembrane protein 170A [Aethina tumida]XP_019876880.1 transmembrane protein 170A [Aethina tumida]XP_019876881.1 transmembrane protein 170A [Aethina tumida]XP_049819558.1 transmembrane protein 170A [Aethina tumida]
MDSVSSVLWLQPIALDTFAKMWYHVFLWALFSSIFVHTAAGLIAFLTLRKHKFGKFFPIGILLMGVITPAVTGIVSSAAIAFVYRASSLPMHPLYALFWGCGQTVVTACMGFTRILATL